MHEIQKFISNPKTGLFSEPKLYKKLHEEGYKITHKQLKDIINKTYFYQITKQSRKPKVFNSVYASDVFECLQMDVMDYSRYEKHKYKYIFCIIDVYSRYGFAFALTNHRASTILECLEKIFDKHGFPKNINCDLEFNNKTLTDYAERNNIKMHYSEANDTIKNVIVERWNRTIANLLQKNRNASKDYDWYSYLSEVVDNYNHSYHRTIKEKPFDIFNGITTSKQNIIKYDHQFKVGDKVRIQNKKELFDKGDVTTFSKDVYVVESIKKNKIFLAGVERSFQPHQLKLENELIHFIPNEQQENDYIIEKRNRKQSNILKSEDINKDNIITTPRVRKQKKLIDYDYE